jgi:hypothetical protein
MFGEERTADAACKVKRDWLILHVRKREID